MPAHKNARPVLSVSFVLIGVAAFSAARADSILYQSATDRYEGNDEPIESGRYLGAVFTLDQAASVTGIGAPFVDSAAGTIFGEIVPIPAGSSGPTFSPLQSATAGNYVAGTDVLTPSASRSRSSPEPMQSSSARAPSTPRALRKIGYNNTPTPGAEIFYATEDIYGDTWKTGSYPGSSTAPCRRFRCLPPCR